MSKREHPFFDLPVHSWLGLHFLALTPSACAARFKVGQNVMQVSGQLHGGVSALVAESLASVGASIASGGQLVLGLDVTCSHLRGAPLGTDILAVARPLRVGKLIHVWEVRLYKAESQVLDSLSESAKLIRPDPVLLGGVEVKEDLDEETSRLLLSTERDQQRLVAVGRVSCVVRSAPLPGNGSEIGNKQAAIPAGPRSKL